MPRTTVVDIDRALSQRYRTLPQIGQLPKVEVYVDEYGDRGFSPKASPFFAMTAVMVPEEHAAHMRVVASGLRAEIRTTKPLHWVDHFTPKPKHASRRQLAATLVAGIPGVSVTYVVAHKESMVGGEHLRSSQVAFYNYVTKLLLERVAYQAKGWPGGPRMAVCRLSSIKGTRDVDTIAYLEGVRTYGKTSAPMDFIKWPPSWHGPERYDGLQIADLYMGMMGSALSGRDQDLACAEGLLAHRGQIRRSAGGKVLGFGVKVYGDEAVLTDRAWWGELCAR